MIEARGLGKRFGAHWAVRGASLKVDPGRITGFLGPNGAGKTTTLRMLVGALPPTEGEALVGGRELAADPEAARETIGFLPEKNPLYLGMTPREQLTLCARLRGFGKGAAKEAERVAEAVGLGAMSDRLIDRLSRGFRQRVALAVALVGPPKILLMDEPTTGLDPGQVLGFGELIRGLAAEGVAVLLSSHRLEVVERLCGEVVVIAEGTVRRRLRLAEAALPDTWVAGFSSAPSAEVLEAMGRAALSVAPKSPVEATVRLGPGADGSAVVRAAVEAGGSLLSFTPESSALEREYLEAVAGPSQPDTTDGGEVEQ